MTIIRTLHRLYKLLLSPIFGERCRFHPSCSDYCLGCLETHGLFRGIWLSAGRLLRCNPLFPGGLDPVPPQKQRSIQNKHSEFSRN